MELLIACLNPRTGERVLDVGCGIGLSTARLAATVEATGIDLLPALLEQARFAYPGCRFLEADLLHFQPPEPFDAILAHAVLHWIHPPGDAAKSLFACLKPGGRLAASLGGVTEAMRNVDGYYRPSAREYAKVLNKAGLREIEVELIWPDHNEGTLIATARRPL